MVGRANLLDSAGLKITVSSLCPSLSDEWPAQGTALSKQVLCPAITQGLTL